MYTIIIVGLLFGGQANTGLEFVTKEAAQAYASHMEPVAGQAVAVPQQGNNIVVVIK